MRKDMSNSNRYNSTGLQSVLTTCRASLHEVLVDLQTTHTEEMTISILPRLHGLLDK